MTRENENVRQRAKEAGIPLWMIAAAVGVSEPTLIRWMRFPLPTDKEQRILDAIERLKREEN